jgi:hypothetical protein
VQERRIITSMPTAHRGRDHRESVCRTDAPTYRSYAPWIRLVSTSRCERSCGSCGCRRVGSMPGDGRSTRVRLTISRPVPAHPVSADAPRGPGDQGHGHLARLSARPDRHARRPRLAAYAVTPHAEVCAILTWSASPYRHFVSGVLVTLPGKVSDAADGNRIPPLLPSQPPRSVTHGCGNPHYQRPKQNRWFR